MKIKKSTVKKWTAATLSTVIACGATEIGGHKDSSAWFWTKHSQEEIAQLQQNAACTLKENTEKTKKINDLTQAEKILRDISDIQFKYVDAAKNYKDAMAMQAAADKLSKEIDLALNRQEIELRKEREAREKEAQRLEEKHRRKMEEQRLQMEKEERERIEQINNAKASLSERFSAIKKKNIKQVELAENIERLNARVAEIEEKVSLIDNLNRVPGVEALFEEFQTEVSTILKEESRIRHENLEKALKAAKEDLLVATEKLKDSLSSLNEENKNFAVISDNIQSLKESIEPVNTLDDAIALQRKSAEIQTEIDHLLDLQAQEEEKCRQLEELERNISNLRDANLQLELLFDKKVTLDNIVGGNKKAKAKTHALFNSFKRYSEGGRPPLSKGILYYGDPGTGKTSLAKAIAAEAGMELFFINPSLAMSDNGERKVLEVIELAKKSARISGSTVVLLIDEIDAIAQKRSSSNSDKVLVLLMNEIDKLKAEDNVVIIATTNRREALDSAIIRSGRIDQSVEIGLPNAADKEKILKIYLQLINVDKSVKLNVIVDKMKNFSGADIKRTVDTAIDNAMARQNAQKVSEVVLTNADLQEAIVTVMDEKVDAYK